MQQATFQENIPRVYIARKDTKLMLVVRQSEGCFHAFNAHF